MNPRVHRFRDLLICTFQAGVIVLSLAAAFLIKFDFTLPDAEVSNLMMGLMIAVPIKMAVFLVGGLHRDSWRFAGLTDLARIGVVNFGAEIVSAAAITVYVGASYPRSIHVIDLLICFLVSAGARYSIRFYNETLRVELGAHGKGVLIYGAGATGRTLLRETRTDSSLGLQVLGFVDDNPVLQSLRIMHVPVLGTGRDIPSIVERFKNRDTRIQEVVITVPSATGRRIREVHASCRAAGVACRIIPSLGDILNGKYLTSQLRNISLEDLLGREQIRLEEDRIQKSIVGKSVLVTGAAGSIGSELCRQIASFAPGKLVILDQAESDLFKIDQELRRTHPDLAILPVVCDIRDMRSVHDVVRKHGVDSIYHAAAYKHVPMMESHVLEAVRNNIIGTWNLVNVAHKCSVANFLMISSDKAVNPSSVMGLTKRIAELIVSAASNGHGNGTNFVSVRFGNVLGSNGSVVPTFQAQIAAGGPLTVTHPEIRRYFMSIREAVQLVLQASTMGKGSNIFVLDMGEPVRILDLAHNMIHLAGLVPNEDIEVKITGLRPGEKLFEEIALDGENILPTYHDKIRIFKGQEMSSNVLRTWLTHLQLLLAHRDEEKVLRHLADLVPEYKPPRHDKPAPVEEQKGSQATVTEPRNSRPVRTTASTVALRAGAAE